MGLLDLISARNPGEARQTLAGLVRGPQNRLRGLLDDPAGFMGGALREGLGADDMERRWAWNQNRLDAMTGSDYTRASVDDAANRAALNLGLAGMAQIQTKDVKPIAEDIAKRIRDAGFTADVQHSGSAAGASSYIRAIDEQTARWIRDPIRVSDHSKGPFNSQFSRNIGDTDEINKAVSDYLEKLNELRAMGPSQGLLAQQEFEATKLEKTLSRARNRLQSGKSLSNYELSVLRKSGDIN